MIQILPLSQRPDLERAIWHEDFLSAWKPFMLEDPTAGLYYGFLEHYQDFVLVAFDDAQPDQPVARAFSVPFCFGPDFNRPELPDRGWDGVVRWAHFDRLEGRTPNAVSALEITILSTAQAQGLSSRMLNAMRENPKRLGFQDLFAPVRPHQKHLEPHTPMQQYAFRTRLEDGLPNDAWLRVHVRAGGQIIKIAPHSMTITGTLEDWHLWTGLRFNQSGETIIPGAVKPVYINLEQNLGVYVEPNVWVHHKIES
jgi:GNAT superfamily N-acetyltransferase